MQPAPLPIQTQTGANTPEVYLTGLNADEKSIELTFTGMPDQHSGNSSEQLIIEASLKPFMSVLWLGTVLIIGGIIIAFIRRLGSHS